MAARKKTRRSAAQGPRRTSPAPGGTAPGSGVSGHTEPPLVGAGSEGDDDIKLWRGAALPAMEDPVRRKQWGLPEKAEDRGEYMVELNLRHPGGLVAAALAFTEHLLPAVVGDKPTTCEQITTAYFRVKLNVTEWRTLVQLDEQWESGKGKPPPPKKAGKWSRAIYRVWPDFRIRALTDRSVSTVKADAAANSYEAHGQNIVWAVIDSGVQADHQHFGEGNDRSTHRLRHAEVAELHRDFTGAGASAPPGSAASKANIESALTDPCGHGTHVSGIITGRAPSNAVAFERVYTPTSDNTNTVSLQKRFCETARLRGVAPDTRIVSLRVLNENGSGRSSDVIQALAYIREQVNSNPKMLRIQGVNLSVGYEFDAEMFACGQSPLCAEVDRLVQSGVVVVTAAGNTGYGVAAALARATNVGISNSINDPGNANEAITVGATHRDSPHTYGVSYFSSKGPTGDGRLKPDLVAPGERITSCAAGKKLDKLPIAAGSKKSSARTAAYVDDSGTSMAAPHVSGAIAAFLSIRREFIGKPQDVKRVFLESATPLGRERYFEGRGLVDLMRAIQSI